MSKKCKVILLVLALFYLVLPDLLPGPIDDVILLVFAIGAQFLPKKNRERKSIEENNSVGNQIIVDNK